jgi:hypothetical protein
MDFTEFQKIIHYSTLNYGFNIWKRFSIISVY